MTKAITVDTFIQLLKLTFCCYLACLHQNILRDILAYIANAIQKYLYILNIKNMALNLQQKY